MAVMLSKREAWKEVSAQGMPEGVRSRTSHLLSGSFLQQEKVPTALPTGVLRVIYELCPAGFSETDIISESNEVGLWQTVLGQFRSNDTTVHSIKKSFLFLFLLLNIKQCEK